MTDTLPEIPGAPSAEEFLSTPATPEDVDTDPPDRADPLESIAESLRTIAAGVQAVDTADAELEQLRRDYDQLDQANVELRAELIRRDGLLRQVFDTVKPSTSKLANKVREVLATPLEDDPDGRNPGVQVKVTGQPVDPPETPGDQPVA